MKEKAFPYYLRQHCEKNSEKIAITHKVNENFTEVSYGRFGEYINAASAYLDGQGIKKGDRVALLGENSLNWAIADMAIICLGGVSVAIYPTLTPEDIKHILNNSDSKILFLQNEEQLKKVNLIIHDLKRLEKIIIFDDESTHLSHENLESFSDVIHGEYEVEKIVRLSDNINRDDNMCIIYTSGTTGVPKGVVLTHRNILSVLEAITEMFSDKVHLMKLNLSFLPLSHALERIAGYFMTFYLGSTVAFAESFETIIDNMKELSPSHAVVVPRIFEKVFEKITSGVSEKGRLLESFFWWSVKNGRKVSRLKSTGKKINIFLKMKHGISTQIIFKKLKNALGGNLEIFISGGAPLSVEIAEFFHAADMLILEGYGATETSAPATWNQYEKFKFGSVGLPISGVSVKIAKDGEVLIKGPGVFKEYWKMKIETEQSLSEDGWYRSGDIGYIDDEGFLYIIDRKKELIITASGKNISPARIENIMKGGSHYISNVMAYGDREKYITALVTLDVDNIKNFLDDNTLSVYADREDVKTLIHNEIEKLNNNLARFEQVKKFQIIPEDFSIEDKLLTPSLKLRRKNIAARYAAEIEQMYRKKVHTEEMLSKR